MRRGIFHLSLFVIMLSCGGTQHEYSLREKEVYICVSGTAYAYHQKKKCRGLNECTHKIELVTESVAQKKYKRKPCGWCY